MANLNITLNQEEILQLLHENKSDIFKFVLQKSLNEFLKAESSEVLKAQPYERTDKRTDSRNGFRERPLTTRIGTIMLNVPRHRDVAFHTMLFDNYQRKEQALITTMAEMVVSGVSTRKVSKVMETLCGKSFSKSSVSEACKTLDYEISEFKNRKLEKHYPFLIVDATYFKVREEHRVVSKALMIAVGIDERGYREVIGFETYKNESKQTWGMFFESLKNRGLSGVTIITSDAHEGILYAMKEYFPTVPWQRCHYHFSKNIVDKAPKKYQEALRSDLKAMFSSIDLESAIKKMNQIADEYRDVAEKAIECLEVGFIDAMTNLMAPEKIRKVIRTSNHVERVNKELKRRSNVIGIFPNSQSLIRLMGSILIDTNEKWSAKTRGEFYKPALLELMASKKELEEYAKKQYAMLDAA